MRTRAAVAALAFSGLLVAPATAAAPKKITAEGVGEVKLGATHSFLRDRGLVGVLRPGCELSGPGTRSARLKAPLSGFVDYTLTNPRKVRSINVRGGAKARGVGIGATIAQIKAKFPKAKVNHDTDEVFGLTFVRIPKDGGGRFTFGVRVDTGKTEVIGVPFIKTCE
jgi:hypothetical protein